MQDMLSRHFGFDPCEIFKLDPRIGPLRVADVNGDGRRDIIIANNYKSTIELLIQRESAPKQEATIPLEVNELKDEWRFERKAVSVSWEIQAFEVADVNGDKLPELVFFGDPPELVVVPNAGDGKYEDPITYRVPDGLAMSGSIACGDLNGDGTTDIALLTQKDILIFEGGSSIDLSRPRRVAHTAESPVLLSAPDLNGDGLDDLAILNRSDERPLEVRLQTSSHALGPMRSIKIPRLRSACWSNCLDRKQDDLFGVEDISGRLMRWTLQLKPPVTPGQQADNMAYPLPGGSREDRLPIDVGDVDGDGLADVVAANVDTAQLLLFRQAESVGLLPLASFGGQINMRELRLHDADADGKAEVYVLSIDEQSIAVSHFEEERLTFPKPLPTQGTPQAFDVGRLAGDGSPTVLAYVAKNKDGEYEFLTIDLSTPEAPPATVALEKLDTAPDALRLADVNGDGRTDALIFVPYEPLSPLLQGEDGKFTLLESSGKSQSGLVKDATTTSTAFADVNADGRSELLLASKSFVRALRIGEDKAWEVVDQFNVPNPSAELTGVTTMPLEQGDRPLIVAYDGQGKQLHLLRPAAAGTYITERSIEVGSFGLKRILGSHGSKALTLTGDPSETLLLADKQKFSLVVPDRSAARSDEAAVYETSIRDGYLYDLDVGDLNHDGRTDVAVAEVKDHFMEILTFGPGESLVRATKFRVFSKKQFRSSNREQGSAGEPSIVRIADVTGDGSDDLILVCHDRVLLYPGQ
jgi:hypothetical protein